VSNLRAAAEAADAAAAAVEAADEVAAVEAAGAEAAVAAVAAAVCPGALAAGARLAHCPLTSTTGCGRVILSTRPISCVVRKGAAWKPRARMRFSGPLREKFWRAS
jgi:hypothetical protein